MDTLFASDTSHQSLIEDMAQPLLTVNAQGVLHHANLCGKRELQSSRCLSLIGRQVKATFTPDHQTLSCAIQKAAHGQRSVVRLRILGGGRNDELLVLVTPLHGQSDRIALQLERPALCDPTMLGLISTSYQLTHSEARVLGHLCEGLDVPEIALELKVAPSTIRSHVTALRSKTMVSSIRDLIQKMAKLPAVSGVTAI